MFLPQLGHAQLVLLPGLLVAPLPATESLSEVLHDGAQQAGSSTSTPHCQPMSMKSAVQHITMSMMRATTSGSS